ncbi:MAG TPA: hypothetical protein ENK04_07790 [Gammaproteobacteria bacterium]|nr:hypothetical protein [Gammaproteobacteria bacterium]
MTVSAQPAQIGQLFPAEYSRCGQWLLSLLKTILMAGALDDVAAEPTAVTEGWGVTSGDSVTRR